MSNLSLIETARDFNRFYTNFLGLLNKAYLDTPFTLTDARILFEVGSHDASAPPPLSATCSSTRPISAASSSVSAPRG